MSKLSIKIALQELKIIIIMKSLKEKLVVLFLFGTCIFVQAQDAIPTSGGNASGIGGSASYTIGQVSFTYQSSSNGFVSQGVQQSYEITTALGTEETTGITLEFTVYPNPTTSNVVLKIKNYSIENLAYSVFDINGRSIITKEITGAETFISMENLAGATYFIKIIKNTKELKSFKIIKI